MMNVLLLSTHSLGYCLRVESDHPAFGPPTSLSLNLASSSITPAGYVHESMGDSVVRMCVQLKRWCVGVVEGGGIVMMDVIWRRLCVSEIVCSELDKDATNEVGKHLFSAANVWWRCEQYFVIASCG